MRMGIALEGVRASACCGQSARRFHHDQQPRRPVDRHLTLQTDPREEAGDVRVLPDVPRLRAFEIGEKDQPALVEALEGKAIGAAFLDVTSPEPLPEDHELWGLDNAHVTMHLSGLAQDKMFVRSADRFLENLANYRAGKPLSPIFDPHLGY